MKDKKIRRRILALILVAACIAALASCAGKSSPALNNCGVIHEPEFGGVYIKNTIEEFNRLGFAYGDSVTVSFSNGYVLEDIPYYNGYYTQTGDPLLIAYPGYDYIKAAINNGADLWTVAGLTEDATAKITLVERGKYADIQAARDIHYKDDRALFESDAVFANFRNIRTGNLRECLVYRSASPCDNQHNRAPYTDALISDAGVRYILDLADTEEKLQGYIGKEGFASPYFLSLYQSGNVLPLAMNMNFASEEFRGKIAAGFTALLEQDGPYLIHCTEGKDRTGFVCMLLEALCGASYEEIVADYMITYDNYYQITEESDKAKYDVIVGDVLDPMIRSMAGDETINLRSADLSGYARSFLLNAGMSGDAVDALIAKLTGQNP